jgi:serine/threonine protein kinase
MGEEDRYQRMEKIGEGTYGIVHKCLDRESNRLVAVKRIRLEHEDEGVPSTAIREISLLKELSHENVVSLLDIQHSETRLSLVFEFIDFDLKKLMEKRGGPLTLEEARAVLRQMCEGMEHCHENRVIHRDIKPQNVLVSQDLRIKLADFGLARTYSLPMRSYTHEVVTLWYRAPEILLGEQKYTTAVDMWAIGCVFY